MTDSAAMDRVLIIEDSETQALRLGHLLETAGLRVDCAHSAEEALQKLNETLPDLVVTDFHLPGMDGDELCRRLRMNLNTRDIPILMLTSEEESRAESEGLVSGADDYVRKSEGENILLPRIRALLRKSRVGQVISTTELPFAAIRVLVVEDSDTYREFISEMLRGAGYEVDAERTAAAALERLASMHYDGIVLDLILPDMNGAELCRRFADARRDRESAFGILVLSGGEDKEEMNTALAAGADDVVGKSRDLDIIKARLHALVRRKLLYEQNQRIARERHEREVTLVRAHAEKDAAEARAALAGQLAQANRQLETANRELREAQAQLVQSAKMASLGQLVAGVAHEINNPLAFIMSHRATIEENLLDVVSDSGHGLSKTAGGKLAKARQRLEDMGLGLDRIRDLIVKLRTFSRLDEGEFKQVDIEDSIESVLTLLQHRLRERVTVVRNYGGPREISCFPGPLNQVLMNVISNAIDAIEGSGEITITTAKSDHMFILSVADTGSGIPAAVRDRIFEPFFTTKPIGQGTGLGLAISWGIVKKHNGDIDVRSEEGKGTEFIIRIPMQREGERHGDGQ